MIALKNREEIQQMIDFLEESLEVYRKDDVYEIEVCVECEERAVTRQGNHVDDPLDIARLDCDHYRAEWPIILFQSPHESYEVAFALNFLNYLLEDNLEKSGGNGG